MIGKGGNLLGIAERFVRRPKVMGGVAYDASIAATCAARGAKELAARHPYFTLFPEPPMRAPSTE